MPIGQRLGLIVAGTIRTDRYEVMQTAPQLAGVDLGGLRRPQTDAGQPIPERHHRPRGPGQRRGPPLGIAPTLVERLLDDAAEGGDALPLLALTLRRLYDRYAVTGELTLANYQAMGGMGRVVQTAVDEVLSADPGQRSSELRRCGRRSSRGWPPSTPITTNPCAGPLGMPTCPSPAAR